MTMVVPVAAAARGLALEEPSQVLVASDDVDLPFGRLRLRGQGGAGGQRGLADIIEHLGTKAFPRLRFGVGRPHEGGETSDHVLDAFSESDERALEARIARAAEAIACAVCVGVPIAMNEFNREAGGEDAAAENP